MQRPVMNPELFVEEPRDRQNRRDNRAERWRLIRVALRSAMLLIKQVYAVLVFDPLAHMRGQFKVERGSRASRFTRWVLTRLAFAPLVVTAIICALVWSSTHPASVVADVDPTFIDVYYDPINCVSDDGVRLDGWLVPTLDARTIVEEGNDALKKKYPAVVLVHDFAANRQRMLPFIKPLHDAGFVVLVISTRGCGASAAAGVTFGLNESLDVKAAVELLRRRPFVDPKRIAVVGTGAGATAALLRAAEDPKIAALVLDAMPSGIDQVLTSNLAPREDWLQWMRPLCKWAFELSYNVDADEIDLNRHESVLKSRPVLVLSCGTKPNLYDAKKVQEVRKFLVKNLGEAK